jgi:hypothetical protein
MAFNVQSWGRISSSANNKITTLQNGSFVGAPNVFTYVSASDTVATISGANYFNPVVVDLNLGDFIYAVGSDTTIFLTVATLTVQPPAVTTATGVVTGDVLGPASSINNDIVVFDGTTGKIIKDSGLTVGYIQQGQLIYAADVGATDTYAITLSPVPAAYANGFMVNFKANTANTGTATLNVNGLGAITIVKAHDQTLATGDIEAGQIVQVVYDSVGPVFQMQSQAAVNIPTGALNTVLQGQGLGSQPAYSTATYPPTTTINQFLYSSAANTVVGLTTANNGLAVTSNTGVPSILAGPGTTGNVLQSNAAAAPSFSTATYPSATTINQILYSSSANVVAGLTTVNSAVLVTSSTGVPGFSATMTDGQVIIGSTGATPVAAALTAGAGISITPGAGTITIATSGVGTTWVDQTTTPVTIVANNGYSANNAGLVTLDMPATAAFGAEFTIQGEGAGGWLLQMNTGQVANLGNAPTSSAGSLASTNRYDSIKLVCTVANTTFNVLSAVGNITVA